MDSLTSTPHSVSLYSAGQNNCFQLGRGGDCKDPGLVKIADYGELSSNSSTKYLDLSNISSISCGNGFTLAVLRDGTAYGWGYNENGCLSFSDRKEKNTPKKIDCVTDIKMASCGDSATVFLSHNNENNSKKYGVYMTDDSKGLIKIDNDLKEEIEYVCCSCSQLVWMIGKSGAIYKYTHNSDGSNDESNQDNVLIFSNPNIKAKKITAGSGFAVIINENDNDELYGFGKMTDQSDSFVKVESMSGHPIEKVVSFNEHCIALTKDHRVFVWGKGTFGCLGLGNSIKNTDNKFLEIESLRDKEIIDIGAGNSYSCFVSSNGDLYSCGLSKDGRTMMGDTNDRKIPEKSKKVNNVKKVFCGSSHTIIACYSDNVKDTQNSTGDSSKNYSQTDSNEGIDFLTLEQMRTEVEELRKENRIIKEENYRLRSANLSLEAENNELQKTLAKVTKKKIVEGCMSDAEYSNPIKMFNVKEISKMKKLQQTNDNQFSEEFKVESTTNYTVQYLKIFNNEPKKFKHYLNQHSQVLTTLHPCINRVIGYSFNFNNQDKETTNSSIPCIVTESQEKTLESLFSNKDNNILNNTEKAQIITEIILGMRYLHSMNISHKNINPTSILMTNSGNHIKIADIGLSEYNTNTSFISPELSEKMKVGKETMDGQSVSKNSKIEFDKKCDIFAFGSLLYYILSDGVVPKIDQVPDEIFIKDDKNRFNDVAKEIIQMCWIPDNENNNNDSAKRRPEFSEIFDKLKYINFQISKDVCAAVIEKTVFDIEYFEQKQAQIKQRHQLLKLNKNSNQNQNVNQVQIQKDDQEGINNKNNENNGFYPIMPPSFPFDGELPAVSPRIHIRKPPVFRPIAGKTSK
ncbi:hypothetical protein M9Y10_046059 [Tritrichomonas musculus]|uniref:Protein kinase domain-containing protein n=1 Tax=Tritrichomonas musculus TaxID=1915356 RepID=A0ABR2JX13_9EUKA